MPQEPEVKALLSPSPEEQDRSVDEAREEIKTANKLRKKVPLITQIMALAAGNTSSREFVLRVVQPGLAGLMDGSVSTLAPIFAAAFITKRPMDAFLVGIASAMGAGISMAFSEALSDDGVLTGRGSPVIRS